MENFQVLNGVEAWPLEGGFTAFVCVPSGAGISVPPSRDREQSPPDGGEGTGRAERTQRVAIDRSSLSRRREGPRLALELFPRH